MDTLRAAEIAKYLGVTRERTRQIAARDPEPPAGLADAHAPPLTITSEHVGSIAMGLTVGTCEDTGASD